MTCRKPDKACKTPGEEVTLGFDLTWFCARTWSAGSAVDPAVAVRPLPLAMGGTVGETGYEYTTTLGGFSGSEEPAWPSTGSVTDGSVTWTAQAMSNASLVRAISSVTWSVEAGTVTLDNDAMVNTGGQQKIATQILGGSNGERALVRAHVTYSDGDERDYDILVDVKEPRQIT